MTVGEIKSKAQFDELLASGKTIFIDFYANWCGPCRMISPEFEKLAKDHANEGAVEFFKLNIDDVGEVAEELRIQSIPLFHAYKDGAQIGLPVVGANRNALTTLVTGHAKA